MARSEKYGTKQNKVEDCHQWPMHHKGATSISKASLEVDNLVVYYVRPPESGLIRGWSLVGGGLLYYLGTMFLFFIL